MEVIGGGTVHVYEAKDEGPHTPAQVKNWQESVVLVWWDAKQGVGGYYRIGHEFQTMGSEQPMVALWSNTITPQGVHHKTLHLPLRDQDRSASGFGSGDDTAHFDYDGQCAWTIEDQDLSVKLRVHDFHPSIDCYPKKGAISDFAPHHMEVAGRVTGTVVVKGVRYEVDALGFRDHGWGLREWTQLLSHRWVSGVFGPELSFCMLCWLAADDSMATFGWIVQHDTVTYAKDIDILSYMDRDGVCNRGGKVSVTLTTGEKLVIEAEPVAPCIVSWHHGIACADTLCTMRIGDKVGIGDFETTNNTLAGKRRPKNLVRGVIDNGWHPAN